MLCLMLQASKPEFSTIFYLVVYFWGQLIALEMAFHKTTLVHNFEPQRFNFCTIFKT